MAKPRIVINIYGGSIQDIFTSDRGVEVVVVNWDTDNVDPSTETFKVRCSDGERRRAIVTCRAPFRLEDLAGTDAAAALNEAGIKIGTNCRSMRDDSGLFALYDLDLGELVSTAVFCSYLEAAHEIDPRLTNVTVVRIQAE
ncbi:MAG TPA: hypothetical protein VHC22_02010 [Pirellulales bacterium]|nr:hypothetical protein [Pirellulales bacterium]